MASPAATKRAYGTSSIRWRRVRGRFWRNNELTLRLGPAIVGGLALLGCTSQQVAGPVLPPAPLPSFAVGNAYSFDDGRIERVAGTSAGLVRWRGEGGFVFTTTDNVLLPRVAWSDRDQRGERTMSVAPGALFPLSQGNNVSFRATRHTVEGGAVTDIAEAWQCRVDDTARVATQGRRLRHVPCGLLNEHGAIGDDADTHILLRARHQLLRAQGGSNRRGGNPGDHAHRIHHGGALAAVPGGAVARGRPADGVGDRRERHNDAVARRSSGVADGAAGEHDAVATARLVPHL